MVRAAAEVLGRRGLLRYLCRTAFRLPFQFISLPLCFIGFCTLRCHTYSFPQRGKIRLGPCGFQTLMSAMATINNKAKSAIPHYSLGVMETSS